MIILLSPAKTLDFESPAVHSTCTIPDFLSFSKDLISGLRNLSSKELSELMGISPKLAELNRERFLNWQHSPSEENSKQAILAFKGDVYEGMRAWEFSKKDFVYAQKNLRVLSGLYGILKPLDLIQAHRLEMGTAYANPAGKDLYSFWGDRLNKKLNEECKKLTQCHQTQCLNDRRYIERVKDYKKYPCGQHTCNVYRMNKESMVKIAKASFQPLKLVEQE